MAKSFEINVVSKYIDIDIDVYIDISISTLKNWLL